MNERVNRAQPMPSPGHPDTRRSIEWEFWKVGARAIRGLTGLKPNAILVMSLIWVLVDSMSTPDRLRSIAAEIRARHEFAPAMTDLDARLAPTQGIEMLDADGDHLAGVSMPGDDGQLVSLAHY